MNITRPLLGFIALSLVAAPFLALDSAEASSPASDPVARPSLPPEAVIVVEVLGQSNAWGTQSFIADVEGREFTDIRDRAFIWNKISSATAVQHVDDGEWAPLTVGYGRSGPNSIGPELSLASELLGFLDRPIYVIKCARGETALMRTAQKIDWHPESQGEVFELWRDYYHRPALEDLVAKHGAGNVFHAGIAWFQGAADAEGRYDPAAQLYSHNLGRLAQALRAEAGYDIPLLIGRSENYTPSAFRPHIERVRFSQSRFAETTHNSDWFSTDRTELPNGEVLFPFGPDLHHFNGQAQVHLGDAMAAGLVRLGYLWPVQF